VQHSRFTVNYGILLANSFVNLHMKNPRALTMKDKIVKVSVRIQGRRWDTGMANHMGLVNCTTTPSPQLRRPYRNRSSPNTLTTIMNSREIRFMIRIPFSRGYKVNAHGKGFRMESARLFGWILCL
jgi:hypothetical protein